MPGAQSQGLLGAPFRVGEWQRGWGWGGSSGVWPECRVGKEGY